MLVTRVRLPACAYFCLAPTKKTKQKTKTTNPRSPPGMCICFLSRTAEEDESEDADEEEDAEANDEEEDYDEETDDLRIFRSEGFASACSVAASYKPPMLVTRARPPACALEICEASGVGGSVSAR